MSFIRVTAACLIGVIIASAPLYAQRSPANPDFTAGEKIPQGSAHDWNLGPTGIRGWIYSNRLETTEARQIYVTKIAPDSPASTSLQPGDVILGMGDGLFSYDPRTEFGKAITQAESTDGMLSLIRWRDGETESVQFKIPVLGSYSVTAPFECLKSKRIFDQGCAALARRMQANPNAGNGIVRSFNTLALLSSGRQEYLPIIREQVRWAASYSDPQSRTLHSWFYGPINILLAEYTLATGDPTFLPDLKRVTMEIVNGQSTVGSWGHRFALPNGRLKGYGMMNAPGLPLTLSLILARKAGVDDPKLDLAIEKSARLLRFYVGKGCVPYGDHAPWIETHDDNGKNGAAAVMFNLLSDERAVEYFSRMSVASHGGEREMGHTGNFFNMLWAMPGVALSGPHATGTWMKEFGWYYDLARGWDGTYVHQGPPQAKPDSYRNWDSTGAYLLAYAQPLKQLYITGRQDSAAPQIDARTAAQLIADGQGYSHRQKQTIYADRKTPALFKSLSNWSPVVRDRAAKALARRPGDHVPGLVAMLDKSDVYSRLGACRALAELKNRAATAVPALQKTLRADELWVRIKAAEALAGIGKPAQSALPELLEMLAQGRSAADPRGMQQRYLCFAIFNRRSGLLKSSLDDVDRNQLYQAIRAGLKNEDGRARGALSSAYKRLSYDEIQPLLPSIHQAVVTPAPSGNMFADEIRLSGLEVLASHRIEEGMSLCVDLIEPSRWGSGKRVTRCLKILQRYGGAAKDLLPRLEQLKKELKKQEHIELLNATAVVIQSDSAPREVRPLNPPASSSE